MSDFDMKVALTTKTLEVNLNVSPILLIAGKCGAPFGTFHKLLNKISLTFL